jgi:hypothetical protein
VLIARLHQSAWHWLLQRWGPCFAAAIPGRNKTRTERRGEPAFPTLVEVLARNRWRVHMNVARSVDALLAGRWEAGAGLR